MSDHLSQRGALLAQFKEHLAGASYNSGVVRRILGRHRITTGELAIGPVVGVGTVSPG